MTFNEVFLYAFVPAFAALMGALAGSLVSIWLARYSAGLSEAIRLTSAIKDRTRECLLQIKRTDPAQCASDIIKGCVSDCRPIVTQLQTISGTIRVSNVIRAWNTFAYGDKKKTGDDNDTHAEYWFTDCDTKETRKKAIGRIESVLSSEL